MQAQVEVGVIADDGQKRNFSSGELIKIKNSTITFYVPEAYKTVFSEVLDEVWTISEYELTSHAPDEMTTGNINPLFYFDVKKGQNSQVFDIRCKLGMKDYNGKNLVVASFPLYQSAKLNRMLIKQSETIALKHLIYTQPDFHNMSTLSLKTNLQAINNLLAMGKTQWMDEDVVKNTVMQNLQNETLYIPTYCLLKPNFISGTEENLDKEKLMKNYPYPWKIGEPNGDGDRFVLMFAQTGVNVYISIYDNLSGQFIYQTKNSNQFYLKKSNLKDIAKLIG
ncbi:MAG: hypothetical protein ACP5DZ_11150 [Bacteroidales bacterium]